MSLADLLELLGLKRRRADRRLDGILRKSLACLGWVVFPGEFSLEGFVALRALDLKGGSSA